MNAPPSINTGPSTTGQPGFEIARRPSGHFELKIWGRFAPNWMGSLSSGLSRNGVSILSGNAKKVKITWHAELEITATGRTTDLDRLDYLALAQENVSVAGSVDIALDEFVLDDDLRKHDGAVELAVKAKDQLGFLGALLNRLAFYTLFPEQMIIETVDGKIFDRFWIKGIGGHRPSAAAIKILRQKLEGYLK